ncbi:MAG: disulfide bond formation protein B [Acidimicrobiia bacterium]|nr:disulfide bond formation protein B [bacterium]MXZ06972.1 disulfide bond formation protein B [Acidimicrobiia bacterium]MYF25921.1 disulfide bond formation protein B [Acidimicrobiia bacterium]
MVLFFSFLSVLALSASLGLIVLTTGPNLRSMAVREFGGYALPVALVVAGVSTAGSLYMSEVEGFVPCLLCWVQRGFMYPLVLILLWAVVFPSRPAKLLAMVLSMAGALTATYHYGEQQGWWGGTEEFCSAEVPCTFMWVEQFGFMSIPFMAFTGFCLIALLVALDMRRPVRSTTLSRR